MDSNLKELESQSIYILREAYANFRRMAMLWSIGKDSTVLLWLARKAFFGHVPFPLIHIDTTFKIPEMIQYRNELVQKWDLELLIGKNTRALQGKETFPDGKVDRINCCRNLKTSALQQAINGGAERYRLDNKTFAEIPDADTAEFTAVIAGIRADEEGSRAKERYFSPRSMKNKWEIDVQPPEFWSQYNTDFPAGCHVRIHPLLDWTELNVWQYIEQEKIPTVSLYYNKGDGKRYRSLGCYPCTAAITSDAKSPKEIIVELSQGALAKVPERAGRAQDKDEGGLETLRREGYM
ncbi:MAG: sulfate adenylyltransferase subunit CysD [Pseudobdellovibrionaceae bacterium]